MTGLTGWITLKGWPGVNGCLGGPLTVENGYVAKNRLSRVIKRAEQKTVRRSDIFENAQETLRMTVPIQPNNVLQLEGTLVERLKKAEQIEEVLRTLPGIDCGSCGSPTCRALAWDIVHGNASEMELHSQAECAHQRAGSPDDRAGAIHPLFQPSGGGHDAEGVTGDEDFGI